MIRSYPSPAQHFASSRPIPVDAPVTIASGRSAMKNLLSCGGQNHLGPFILIFLEDFVASRRFFQGKPVADEEFSVDLTLSDTVEKIVAIALHMRLPDLHLHSFFHDCSTREFVSSQEGRYR